MSFSPRPAASGTPRPNHLVTVAARDLAWAATDLDRASKALAGREYLIAADVAELRRRIESAQATIARVSAEMAAPDTGLLVRGATNEFPAVAGGLRP